METAMERKKMISYKTQTTVTKIFKFCYAHHLPGYNGKCANLHGHNSTVEVEVRQHPGQYPTMVLDFRELKKAGDALFEKLDHKDLNQLMQRPTAESICEYIMVELRFAEFDVIRVRVYEADDSFAEIKIVE